MATRRTWAAGAAAAVVLPIVSVTMFAVTSQASTRQCGGYDLVVFDANGNGIGNTRLWVGDDGYIRAENGFRGGVGSTDAWIFSTIGDSVPLGGAYIYQNGVWTQPQTGRSGTYTATLADPACDRA